MLTPEEKEELRHAVLEFIAIRHPAALTRRQIFNGAKKEVAFAFTEDDTNAAVNLLAGMNFAKAEMDRLGSTEYWSATSQGVLEYERNQ